MKRTPLGRSTYRTLRPDEPDPVGEPLVYNASDGRIIHRWKVAPRQYVERVLRNADGSPQRWRPITAIRVDRDEAVSRYEAGESTTAIAEAMGCDAGNLSRLLRRAGVTPRKAGDYATPFDAAEVVARHRAGEGHVSIARDLGVSTRRITEVLRAAGVTPRSAGRVKGRGAKGGAVTFETEFQSVKPQVRERSGGLCEARVSPRCSGRGTHVHHRQLRSQGGTNDVENLLDVCVSCHSFIHANPAKSYALGLLIRRSA